MLRYAVTWLMLYLACLFVFSNIRSHHKSLMQTVFKDYVAPGGPGYSLARFREAAGRGPADVLMMGSSHAFYGFDPRYFERRGLSAFCLGSLSQTPMNSYYLFQDYAPRLQPKILVYSAYFVLFERDGLESFYDLVVNAPLTHGLFRMALATRQIPALNAFFSELFGRMTSPYESRAQRDEPGFQYIPGGYVETDRTYSGGVRGGLQAVQLSPKQLLYFRRLLEDVRARGIRAVVVAVPITREYLERFPDHAKLSEQIRQAAEASGALYLDYQERDLGLDSHNDFQDAVHLNRRGVRVLNESLLRDLESAGLFR